MDVGKLLAEAVAAAHAVAITTDEAAATAQGVWLAGCCDVGLHGKCSDTFSHIHHCTRINVCLCTQRERKRSEVTRKRWASRWKSQPSSSEASGSLTTLIASLPHQRPFTRPCRRCTPNMMRCCLPRRSLKRHPWICMQCSSSLLGGEGLQLPPFTSRDLVVVCCSVVCCVALFFVFCVFVVFVW